MDDLTEERGRKWGKHRLLNRKLTRRSTYTASSHQNGKLLTLPICGSLTQIRQLPRKLFRRHLAKNRDNFKLLGAQVLGHAAEGFFFLPSGQGFDRNTKIVCQFFKCYV
nr:MAG TPA: hypothetical protein [Caudoviricetes sp.]